MDSTERFIRDRVSEVEILPSTPFAVLELLPPEAWTAISIYCKALNEIRSLIRNA